MLQDDGRGGLLGQNPDSDRVKMQNTLRDQLDAHYSKGKKLAVQYNSLSLIFMLPPDVLLHIFSLLTHLEDLSSPSHNQAHNTFKVFMRPKQQKRDPTKYVRDISQVCHVWRELSVNCPSLWNTPLDCSLTPRAWASELLRRSRSMPLQISLNCFEYHDSNEWIANYRLYALENLNRLQELHLLCSRSQFKALVIKRLRGQARILRRLVISDDDYDGESDDSTLGVNRDFDSDSDMSTSSSGIETYLPNFPVHQTPNLRSLSLQGYLFPQHSPIYDNLSELCVFLHGLKPPSITEWSNLLGRINNLSSLTLENCVMKIGETAPPLIIPKLKHLRLCGGYRSAGFFFMHLFASSTLPLSSINLTIRNTPLIGEDLDRFVDSLLVVLKQHCSVAPPKSIFAGFRYRIVSIYDSLEKSSLAIRIGFPPIVYTASNVFLPLRGGVGSKMFGIPPTLVAFPRVPQQMLAVLMLPFLSVPGVHLGAVLSFASFDECFGDNPKYPLFPLSFLRIRDVTVGNAEDTVDIAYTGYNKYLKWRVAVDARLDTFRVEVMRGAIASKPPARYEALKNLCGNFIWAGKKEGSFLDSKDSLVEGLQLAVSDESGDDEGAEDSEDDSEI